MVLRANLTYAWNVRTGTYWRKHRTRANDTLPDGAFTPICFHSRSAKMPKLKSIIFFADGSEETQAVLQRVLLSRTFGSLLDRFLEQSRQVLQEELRKIPQIDRAGLPEFHNLSDFLSDKFDESLRHPALHPTEIVLAQLGSFIA